MSEAVNERNEEPLKLEAKAMSEKLKPFDPCAKCGGMDLYCREGEPIMSCAICMTAHVGLKSPWSRQEARDEAKAAITDAQGVAWFEARFGVPIGDMPGALDVARLVAEQTRPTAQCGGDAIRAILDEERIEAMEAFVANVAEPHHSSDHYSLAAAFERLQTRARALSKPQQEG